MILDVTESKLPEIKNPVLRDYADIYVRIYQDFMNQVQQMGLEIESEDTSALAAEKTKALQKRGAIVRNNDKSIYTNHISPSCVACQTGMSSSTFFISLKCHRDCFYCFNPNQNDYAYYREHTRDTISELDALYASNKRVKHLALTGGEPLLHKAEAISFFEHARKKFPTAYTRLYTCGDHIDRETLEALQQAGMDEIRFSIRMHDLARGHRHVFEQMALAKEYIQNVMVEMPVLPGTLEDMKEVLLELDQLGVFGINLLEFCFPLNNPDVFREKGYKIKATPFRILYDYWYSGGLPVAGSELVCLALMEYALEEGLEIGVHYCSLENKHTGQIYQQNSGHRLPKTLYFSQMDYFLKSAKVFGQDVPVVRQFFDKSDYRDYQENVEHGYLEFHVSQVRRLKKFDLEIGISTNVVEIRDEVPVLRELKVDVTTPKTFQLSKDV